MRTIEHIHADAYRLKREFEGTPSAHAIVVTESEYQMLKERYLNEPHVLLNWPMFLFGMRVCVIPDPTCSKCGQVLPACENG